MAARTTMGTIITHVRRLIGDPGSAQYSDDTIQAVLDNQYRADEWYQVLTPQGTISPGGTVAYWDFYTTVPWWEGSAVLYDGAYGTVTASVNDWARGHWTFSGTAPERPVMVTGAHYDVYGAAAELLDMWAGSVSGLVDYSDPNHSIKYSQLCATLRARAAQMRGFAPPCIVRMYRGDCN